MFDVSDNGESLAVPKKILNKFTQALSDFFPT